MPARIIPVIQPTELLQLKQQEEIVLVDARAGKDAREQYIKNHLAGALFVDLEQQLATKTENAANGGRHPLPTPQKFAVVLNGLGISPNNHVVIYDDKNGSNAAARFWWMLRAAGHKQVQVLDGGMNAAVAAGFPVSSEKEQPKIAGNYELNEWKLPQANIEEVEQAAQQEDHLVIDVRDAYRYNGESEPIDLVAGHIPGAVNIPFAGNLDEDGFFLSPEELLKKYQAALENKNAKNIIVHCGSGVTACHTLLAMDYAGLDIPKLYVGSWSEWSRTERPIGKKDASAGEN